MLFLLIVLGNLSAQFYIYNNEHFIFTDFFCFSTCVYIYIYMFMCVYVHIYIYIMPILMSCCKMDL